jgi:poly(hydroxyalkanoate) depolymerase family esterase
MNTNFVNALRSAMNLIRDQELADATRIIQGALSGVQPVSSESPSEAQVVPLAIQNKFIDLTAEVIEPETTVSAELKADSQLNQSQPSRFAKLNTGALGNALAKLRHTELPRFSLDGLTLRGPHKALEIPEGAQYLSRSFACAAGTRSYKLYIPSHHQTGRRALLVRLHGGTQDADDFAAGTRMNALAEAHGFIVAYPSQSKAANASLCWNWFTPENQIRGRGEPSIIAGITKDIIASYDIDPARVFVAGLSAGGAMAAVMGATYADLYAAVGVHSGLPYRSAADLPSAFAAMHGNAGPLGLRSRRSRSAANDGPQIRTIVFHGDADHIVHPSNAASIVRTAEDDEIIERAEPRNTAARAHTRTVTRDKTGKVVVEQWLIHGGGHAWSGGSPNGTYTDPQGPDASREMLRFFFEERPVALELDDCTGPNQRGKTSPDWL